MKKSKVTILFLFVSIFAFSQSNDTASVDTIQNIAKSMNVVTYGNVLKTFRTDFKLSKLTMAAWISSIESDVLEVETEYSLERYDLIELGQTYTCEAVQIEVLHMLERYRYHFANH
jgi:hypothetical protein